MAQHLKLSQRDSPKPNEEFSYKMKVPYANAVGSLMYVIICARPGLAYAMSVFSIYVGKLGKLH